MERPMQNDPLKLDVALMQSLLVQATAAATPLTLSKAHFLRAKRNATTAPTLRQTRDQRAFDVRGKSLKPDDDMLLCLRRLEIGNYFCVPIDQSVAVRNMTHREFRERGIKYTTTKFVYGKHQYLKVHRPVD